MKHTRHFAFVHARLIGGSGRSVQCARASERCGDTVKTVVVVVWGGRRGKRFLPEDSPSFLLLLVLSPRPSHPVVRRLIRILVTPPPLPALFVMVRLHPNGRRVALRWQEFNIETVPRARPLWSKVYGGTDNPPHPPPPPKGFVAVKGIVGGGWVESRRYKDEGAGDTRTPPISLGRREKKIINARPRAPRIILFISLCVVLTRWPEATSPRRDLPLAGRPPRA